MIFDQIFQYFKFVFKTFVENYVEYNFLEKFLKQVFNDLLRYYQK